MMDYFDQIDRDDNVSLLSVSYLSKHNTVYYKVGRKHII